MQVLTIQVMAMGIAHTTEWVTGMAATMGGVTATPHAGEAVIGAGMGGAGKAGMVATDGAAVGVVDGARIVLFNGQCQCLGRMMACQIGVSE